MAYPSPNANRITPTEMPRPHVAGRPYETPEPPPPAKWRAWLRSRNVWLTAVATVAVGTALGWHTTSRPDAHLFDGVAIAALPLTVRTPDSLNFAEYAALVRTLDQEIAKTRPHVVAGTDEAAILDEFDQVRKQHAKSIALDERLLYSKRQRGKSAGKDSVATALESADTHRAVALQKLSEWQTKWGFAPQ